MEPQITGAERQAALDRLQSSRDLLKAAIAGVSPEQARFTPFPERWSILQLVEHLASSDDHLVGLIRKSLTTPAAPELMEQVQKNDRRFQGELRPFPRGVNRAPEAIRPHARFSSVAEAFAAFDESRDRTIDFARQTQDELRNHFSPHPILGRMDGYQWLMACAVHVESHARQIEELKADPGFPA